MPRLRIPVNLRIVKNRVLQRGREVTRSDSDFISEKEHGNETCKLVTRRIEDEG
jgi:hypothetical protein